MEKRAELLATAALAAALLVLPGRVAARKKTPEPAGVIAGTVFQKTGFSLRGADVRVAPVLPDGAKPGKKQILWTTTDARGEYVVRVPTVAVRYTVGVSAEGWQPAERETEVFENQRVEVNFRLSPRQNGGSAK